MLLVVFAMNSVIGNVIHLSDSNFDSLSEQSTLHIIIHKGYYNIMLLCPLEMSGDGTALLNCAPGVRSACLLA